MRGGFGWACVAVGVCQLCLLCVFYLLPPADAPPYVSTQLMLQPLFNLGVTVTVVFQVAACSVYTLHAAGRGAAVATGGACAVAALCGWAVLAAWSLKTGPHMWGLLVFLSASGAGTAVMLAASPPAQQRSVAWAVAGAYTLAFALTVVFIANYFAGNVAVCTAAEWAAFMCTSAAFVLFFGAHELAK